MENLGWWLTPNGVSLSCACNCTLISLDAPAQPDYSFDLAYETRVFSHQFPQKNPQLNTKCCDDISDGRCFSLNNIVLRPCCFGNRGRCMLLTLSQCNFRAGSWSEDAQLCSDVSCLQKTCELRTASELATKPHPEDSELEDPDQGERFILPLFFHAGFIHYVSWAWTPSMVGSTPPPRANPFTPMPTLFSLFVSDTSDLFLLFLRGWLWFGPGCDDAAPALPWRSARENSRLPPDGTHLLHGRHRW